MEVILFTCSFFIAKINCFIFCWLYNFITFNYSVIILIILTRACTKIPNKMFFHTRLFIGYFTFDIYFYSVYLHNIFYHQIYLLHEICFVIVFYSFIPVIILKTFTFTSSILIGTHVLLDKSSKVLQLPLQLSQLIISG